MDKIVLAYEKFATNGCPIYSFNGRHLPNSISYPDHIMEPYNPTMKLWFKEILTPEKMSSSEPPTSYLFGFVHNNKVHEYKLVDEIEVGTKYFYPIHVLSMWLYTSFVTEISINPKVRNDVLTGNAYIVFIYTSEGLIFNSQGPNLTPSLSLLILRPGKADGETENAKI